MVSPKAKNRNEFIEECKGGDLDGVLVMYRTFLSVNISGRIDEELVNVLPKSLKFVCHNGESASLFPLACCVVFGNLIK